MWIPPLIFFGMHLAHPILLAPVGVRDLMAHDGDRLTAIAALNSKAILVGAPRELMLELSEQNRAPRWWAATLGHATQDRSGSLEQRERERRCKRALCQL